MARRSLSYVAALVLALALAMSGLTALPAAAAPVAVTIDGVEYSADDSNVGAGATVTDFDWSTTAVTIEDTVTIGGDDYDVVAIADSVFDNDTQSNPNLVTVDIGSNVADIGEYAFRDNALTALTLPGSVATIGAIAFQGNALTALNVPSSVADIGSHAFQSNELTDVTLPTGINIGRWTFANNDFTELTLPTGITLDRYSFAQNNIDDLNLPSSMTTIAPGAFGNNNLTNVDWPSSLTTIDDGAFVNNQFTTLELPDTVTVIGERAFRYNQLTTVTLPTGVTSIGENAFDGNPDLEQVHFTGSAPTVVSANAAEPSFDTSNGALVLSFPWSLGDPQTPGGFTTPTWEGYDTQAIATVSFDLNGQGASAPGDQEVVVGGQASAPAEPSEAGFDFTGWYTDAAATTEFDFATDIAGDMTLYAGWQEAEETQPDDGTSDGGSSDGGTSEEDPQPDDGSADDGPILAETGTDMSTAGAVALALIAAGLGALALRRRQQHSAVR